VSWWPRAAGPGGRSITEPGKPAEKRLPDNAEGDATQQTLEQKFSRPAGWKAFAARPARPRDLHKGPAAPSPLVGDDVLMYASDYPHGESHFPESAVGNAARFCARAALD
jgi:hypothetical protein